MVYLISLDRPADQVRMGFADPSGTFALPQIPPGSYRVLALDRPRGELGAGDAEFLKQHESKTQAIQLTAEQKIHLHLPLISATE